MNITKILEGTLPAGQTTITFTDSELPNSLIRIFSTNSELFPSSQVLSGNTLTITYEAQSTNTGIAVEITKENMEIIDNVESSATNKALSANQGKELNASLQQVFTSVSSGKALIAGAITDKGVDTPADATFAEMAENIENISGGGGSDLSVQFIYNGTANGTNTYTITENGIYLLIAGYSFGGSVSITLPAGKTALYEDEVIASDVYSGVERYRGVKVVIASLEVGDTVSLYSTYYNANWSGHGKVIYKLNGVDDKTFTTYNKALTKDASANLPTISDTGDYIAIGIATGNSNTNSYLVNAKTELLQSDMARVGNNFMFTIVMIGNVIVSPSITLYGYSGGQASYFIISIE